MYSNFAFLYETIDFLHKTQTIRYKKIKQTILSGTLPIASLNHSDYPAQKCTYFMKNYYLF